MKTRPKWFRAAVILGGWTVLALLFAPQSYLANRHAPTPLPAWVAVLAQATVFYVWAALTPLVVWLGRRFPFRRGRMLLAAVVHVVGAVVVCGLQIAGVSLIHALLMAGTKVPYVGAIPRDLLLVSIATTNVMLYWAILAVTLAVTYFTSAQERELAVVHAQLESLRSRLQPHFLFNTLNAIAELVYEDPRRAESTLTQLSDVLRLTLQHDREHEITLEQELELLRKHVAIYQVLLHDRLAVRWAVDEAVLDALVPTMLLQPLVENAIRHGIAPRGSGGTICVGAKRDGESLCLLVEDDGVGMKGVTREGIGISNTRARLRHMYGDAFALDLREPDGGGVRVTMRVPLRRAEGRR